MSFCPACGNPVGGAADTRFCARCGKELPSAEAAGDSATPPPPAGPPAAAPPTVVDPAGPAAAPPGAPPTTPPGAPPPPAAAPLFSPPPGTSVPAGYVPPPPPAAPAGPSAAGEFSRRVFSGRWDWPALAALAPAVLLIAFAGLIGGTSGGLLSGSGIGFMARSRCALALLLQGVGGTTGISAPVDDPFGDSSGDSSGDFSSGDSFDDGSGFGDSNGSDGFGDDGSGFVSSAGHDTGHSSLSMVPLTVTVLWVLVLVLALRAMRGRQSGPEAAVRVALLSAAATLVLALVAQPSLQGVHVGSSPVLATLGSLVLAFVTAFVVLPGPGRAAWLAARPQLAAPLRVLKTTAIALAVTIALAAVVVFFVAIAHYHQVTGWGLVLYAFLLPNVGVSGLNLGWGGPFDLSERSGGIRDRVSYDLGDLSHVWSGWAAVGAVAGGLVCALLIGVVAVRRSHSRAEQFAVAGLFTVLFVALAALSSVGSDGGLVVAGSNSHASVGPNISSALLFALLWSFGGVLVAPYVARALGVHGVTVYGAGPVGYPPPAGGAPFGPLLTPPAQGPRQPGGPGVPPQGVPPEGTPPSSAATVHDLGVVQPPRLNKLPDHR